MSISLSKRERIIAIATGALLALVVIDLKVVTPLTQRYRAMQERHAKLTEQLSEELDLLSQRRHLLPTWQAMQPSLKPTADEAETQIVHALRNAADSARVSGRNYRPERLADLSEMPQISVKMEGTGSMQAVTRLLWLLQSAQTPLRLTELQLTSRRPGGDDISFVLRVTTIYWPAKPAQPTQISMEGRQ